MVRDQSPYSRNTRKNRPEADKRNSLMDSPLPKSESRTPAKQELFSHERVNNVAVIRLTEAAFSWKVFSIVKEDMRGVMRGYIDRGIKSFVLDMSKLKTVDSCGVGAIVAANHFLCCFDAKMIVVGLSPFIRRVFDIMGITQHLTLTSTRDEAILAFAGS